MSIVLELRDHTLHAGKPLVHPTSEDVVLANVFGIVKNLDHAAVLGPWVTVSTGLHPTGAEWMVDFWQKQPRPQGAIEGSTAVDLVLETEDVLVFAEVKMDAPASSGTTRDPNRDQLTRNLDVGYARAQRDKKAFALIFITPDLSEPGIVQRLRGKPGPFPASPNTPSNTIVECLHWAPWSSIGDLTASAYTSGQLAKSECSFALDLLAYLAKKGLWENTLEDDEHFYSSKLYRSLRRDGSPFQPYRNRVAESYQAWRSKEWQPEAIESFLKNLRQEHKALLKVLAEAGGAMRQAELMQKLPMLSGKTSASLRSLKSQINAGCKAHDCAQILSDGVGSGPNRIHQINPGLGPLRQVVIEIAQVFEIDWRLLQRS